jgi:hypothetical protein
LVKNRRIDPKLELPAYVAVKGTVAIELTFAQWRMEAQPVPLWQKRNDATSEKGLAIARSFSRG